MLGTLLVSCPPVHCSWVGRDAQKGKKQHALFPTPRPAQNNGSGTIIRVSGTVTWVGNGRFRSLLGVGNGMGLGWARTSVQEVTFCLPCTHTHTHKNLQPHANVPVCSETRLSKNTWEVIEPTNCPSQPCSIIWNNQLNNTIWNGQVGTPNR